MYLESFKRNEYWEEGERICVALTSEGMTEQGKIGHFPALIAPLREVTRRWTRCWRYRVIDTTILSALFHLLQYSNIALRTFASVILLLLVFVLDVMVNFKMFFPLFQW